MIQKNFRGGEGGGERRVSEGYLCLLGSGYSEEHVNFQGGGVRFALFPL